LEKRDTPSSLFGEERYTIFIIWRREIHYLHYLEERDTILNIMRRERHYPAD